MSSVDPGRPRELWFQMSCGGNADRLVELLDNACSANGLAYTMGGFNFLCPRMRWRILPRLTSGPAETPK